MGNTKSTARIKEQKAIALRLQGKTFEQIAEEVGYADRASAYMRTMNAIRREVVEDVAEIRDLEIARIDAMVDSLWPVAMGDPDLIRQFLDTAKLMPMRDDSAAEVVYVISPLAKLQAIDKMIKLMERRSRFLGLDHADGLMERAVQLEEAKMGLLVELLDAAIDKTSLPAQQASQLKMALAAEVRRRLSTAS